MGFLADFLEPAALGLGPVRTLDLAGGARRHGVCSEPSAGPYPVSERVGPAQDAAVRLSLERLKLAPLLVSKFETSWIRFFAAIVFRCSWSSEDSAHNGLIGEACP